MAVEDIQDPDSRASPAAAACRLCGSPLRRSFADLGMSPLSNAYIPAEHANAMEPFYPLHAFVCTECWLVQLDVYETSEHIFSEYAYFSSFSSSWLEHAKAFAAQTIERFDLDKTSQVVELASNDGYLLQYFREAGLPVLGIEPAHNVAQTALAKGIPTLVRFFGQAAAKELAAAGTKADLLIGNNVLGHVPDLNGFVEGMRLLLNPGGTLVMEFTICQNLVEQTPFDTIYHEHFSYFSFSTAERVFARHALAVFDVEKIPTHGGSLRVYVGHCDDDRPQSPRVAELRRSENELGYGSVHLYDAFAERVKATKRDILAFMLDAKNRGKSIVGYGAPAKGNTLLNYCGIGTDMMDYTVDKSPHKQGCLLPGTRIPVYAPERIAATRPDYVIVLPWNLSAEIMEQMACIREWHGRFVVLIPRVSVL